MKVKIAVLVAALFTALFMIWPLSSVIKSVNNKKHGVLTEGTILNRDMHGKGLAKVTVTFNTPDGTQVTASAPKRKYVATGDKAKVWYNPADPKKIDFGDTIGYNMRGVLLIGFMFIICFYFFIKFSVRDMAKRRLIRSGTKVDAEFVSVDRNDKFRMGDKNPWIIKCRWIDNNINKEYHFVSKDFAIDPAPYLKGRSHLDIFIDPADPGKYYMDTSFMPEGNITFG